MAVAVSSISPMAHLPLILGMLRKLKVASIIDGLHSTSPRLRDVLRQRLKPRG